MQKRLYKMITTKAESRPVGLKVATTPAQLPQRITLEGRFVTLVPLTPVHADDLFDGAGGLEHAFLWDYMPDGPFTDRQLFRDQIACKGQSNDFFFAILDKTTGKAVGYAALMNIDPANRVIEVGNILFTPQLQRTPGATECMYLLSCNVFDVLGYRRYEWKCNNLNMPSKRAAQRIGFTWEGVFRQHRIVKGCNRDTAWFSMLDTEWPAVKQAFQTWIAPENFDEQGQQRSSLAALRNTLIST